MKPELTDEHLAELERLCEAATPGPWIRSGIRERLGNESCIRVCTNEESIAFLPIGSQQKDQYHAAALRDAEYIAAFNPATAKGLLAELRSERATNEHQAHVIAEARYCLARCAASLRQGVFPRDVLPAIEAWLLAHPAKPSPEAVND